MSVETYFYAVFVDDHEIGSMRLVATYLEEWAAKAYGRTLSPTGDGISIIKYQALNSIGIEPWTDDE